MSYETFRRRRAELLITREPLRADEPALLDLGELDVYGSLGPSLGPIAPLSDREAPHRCHLAERFLSRLGLDRLGLDPSDASLRARALITHGVRRSLGALFRHFAAESRRVAIPADVYPTYLALAHEAGLAPITYEARLGLPASATLASIDVLVVCSPLKPWGGDGGLDAALAWASGDRRRSLVIDSVYATPPSERVLEAAVCGELILLTSLSKGWLLPDHVGLCLAPEALCTAARAAFATLEKDTTKLRIGFSALTIEHDRPARVRELLRDRAAWLDALTAARPELGAGRCEGYFAISSVDADTLLTRGVLAVPADVFGGPATHSVLSSLPPRAPRSA